MTYKIAFVNALFLGILINFQPVSAQVVLSEIMYDAPTSESYEEFIELYNTSSTDSVSLNGYQIGDQLEQDSLVEQGMGLTLPPNSYALVLDPGYWGHSTIYNSLIPPDALILTIKSNAFGAYGLRNDPPDTIILKNPSGEIIASYTYTSGNQGGYSEEKMRLAMPDSAWNWTNSLNYLGTPGFVNSVQPLNLDLAIAELSANPSPLPFGTALTIAATVVNAGLQPCSGGQIIFSLQRSDSLSADSTLGVIYCEAIAPGETLTVNLSLTGMPPGPQQIRATHNLQDDNPANDTQSVYLLGGYPPAGLIINELLIRTDEDRCEWVELYNPNSFAVDLQGFSFTDSDTNEHTDLLDSGKIIAPATFAIIAKDSTIYQYNPAAGVPLLLLGSSWLILNDNGDTPTLLDAAGTQQDAVPYTGWDLPPPGISLERQSPTALSGDANNWLACINPLGCTPGSSNSIQTQSGAGSQSASVNLIPDPFDPDRQGTQTIEVSLPGGSISATIIAFDLRGRRLRVIFDGNVPSGQTTLTWNGSDEAGHRLSPGLYILYTEFRDQGGKRRNVLKKPLVIAGRL